MKVFRAVGRLLSNPLCAAVICLGGGYAIWLSLAQQPGGAPAVNRGGEQRAGNDKTPERGSNTDGPAIPAAAEAGEKRKLRAGITTKSRTATGPKKSRVPAHSDVQYFEAENEPLGMTTTTAAPKPAGRSPQETAAGSVRASSADVIKPLDPGASALTEYQIKIAAIADTVSAQRELAIWCDQHGLWDGAKTHWETVVRLDPKNEEARKRLGFRLRGGAWVVDAARADDVAQKKANAYWKVLEKYHRQMKCKSKLAGHGRAEAIAHIEAVGDPCAAASIWNEFASNVSHDGLMVGVLSRFNTPEASRMLAAVAVYSQDEKARVAAVAGLRGRAAGEYGEIEALNQRVASVLNEAGGAGIRAQAEDGRRWLASILGTDYRPPPADQPKPTITEIVWPLYNPTFLPIPVAT